MTFPPIPPPFHAELERVNGRVRLRMAGELDLATVPEAEKLVKEARALTGSLEVDLSEVTFIDSSGLRLIVQIDAACRADGCELSLVPGPRGVQRVFDLAGVLSILPFREV